MAAQVRQMFLYQLSKCVNLLLNFSLSNLNNCDMFYVLFLESDKDGCSSSPCKNNATCTDHMNSYTCMCVSGFTGMTCETGLTTNYFHIRVPDGIIMYMPWGHCFCKIAFTPAFISPSTRRSFSTKVKMAEK